jgi:hypothetical protein
MKLVIICVESDKKANTDPSYIDKAIKKFYVIDNTVKLSYQYLGGKGNYNRKGLLTEINKLRKTSHFETSHVVYCIDTDDLNDQDAIRENGKIEDFCKSKGFEFVWFCRDVEEVFLHKQIFDVNKVAEAKKFARDPCLSKATKDSLSAKTCTRYKSNLLQVLDKFMTKK